MEQKYFLCTLKHNLHISIQKYAEKENVHKLSLLSQGCCCVQDLVAFSKFVCMLFNLVLPYVTDKLFESSIKCVAIVLEGLPYW